MLTVERETSNTKAPLAIELQEIVRDPRVSLEYWLCAGDVERFIIQVSDEDWYGAVTINLDRGTVWNGLSPMHGHPSDDAKPELQLILSRVTEIVAQDIVFFSTAATLVKKPRYIAGFDHDESFFSPTLLIAMAKAEAGVALDIASCQGAGDALDGMKAQRIETARELQSTLIALDAYVEHFFGHDSAVEQYVIAFYDKVHDDRLVTVRVDPTRQRIRTVATDDITASELTSGEASVAAQIELAVRANMLYTLAALTIALPVRHFNADGSTVDPDEHVAAARHDRVENVDEVMSAIAGITDQVFAELNGVTAA